MDSQQLRACCGIEVIHSMFGNKNSTIALTEQDAIDVDAFIKKRISEWTYRGVLMATTNENQIQAAEILQKNGFTVVASNVYNPNSGRRINLWVLLINQTKPPAGVLVPLPANEAKDEATLRREAVESDLQPA